jgi:long-chain acyl-CoA synthetase
LFKLAQGEFVSPEKLEGLFSSSDIVDQVYVHGDREQSLLIAVIKPNLDRLKDFLAKNKLEGLAPTWDSSDEVKKAVLKTICEIGLNAKVTLNSLFIL